MEMFSLPVLGLIGVGVLLFFSSIVFVVNRYKRCSSNEILVIFGKVGAKNSARCVHGGGAFVLPLVQDYRFLSLKPVPVEVKLNNAISKENIRVAIPANFQVGIGTTPAAMQSAAERLLDFKPQEIQTLAHDIIIGQLRDVIASMGINEINQDRDIFLKKVREHIDVELLKFGLYILNVNITDITDNSGYLVAQGQKAAEEAKNAAAVAVAEQQRLGAQGVSEKTRAREIFVAQQQSESQQGKAEAEAALRIKVAEMQAKAVSGEADSQALILKRNGELAVTEAEAKKMGEVAKVEAETLVLEARKKQERTKLENVQLVQQEVARKVQLEQAQAQQDALKTEMEGKAAAKLIAAEAEAKAKLMSAEADAKARAIAARADAEAMQVQKEAEAKGIELVKTAEAIGLQKMNDAKASGYKQIAEALKDKATAVLLMEHLPAIVDAQAKAVSGIKIDKVTVVDSQGSDGGVKHLVKSVTGALPTLRETLAGAGIKVPEFLADTEELSEKEEG